MAPAAAAGLAPATGLEYRLYHTQHRECSCGAKDCQGACKVKGAASPVVSPSTALPSLGTATIKGRNVGNSAGRKRKLSDMAGNKMSASQSLMVDAALMSLTQGLS